MELKVHCRSGCDGDDDAARRCVRDGSESVDIVLAFFHSISHHHQLHLAVGDLSSSSVTFDVVMKPGSEDSRPSISFVSESIQNSRSLTFLIASLLLDGLGSNMSMSASFSYP
eukprot:497564-Rhodomonas_salina.1